MNNRLSINYLSEDYQKLNSDLLRSSGGEATGGTLIALDGANKSCKKAILRDITRASGKILREPEEVVVTEAGLKRLFTETENSRWILFFDEADALFGKRTEVKDSHDRYANLETSYLRQAIDHHKGIVILATNRRQDLHKHFRSNSDVVIQCPLLLTLYRRLLIKLTGRAA